MCPKSRGRPALEVHQWRLLNRAPDKDSLCCTCIMNARMRLQMHNEVDFIYHVSLRFNKHFAETTKKLRANRQLSLQACSLASIDSAFYIPLPHGHTHAVGTSKHASKKKKKKKSRAHTQTTENLRFFSLTSLVCLLFEERRVPKEEDEER